MTLTERDIQLIGFCWRMDGVATEHVKLRFWPDSSRTTAHSRLSQLVAAKYLRALRLPPTNNRGSGQTWYVVGSASLPLLTQVLGLTAAERKQLRHATLPAAWRHEIDLRTARLQFELAIDRSGIVTLEEWETERSLRKQITRVNDAFSHDCIELTPDGSFTLVTADGRPYRFYLELDRGTLVSAQRFIPRLRAHLQHAEPHAVLVVVPTVARGAQVSRWAMQAARQLDVSASLFWLTTLPQVTADRVLTHPIWSVVGEGQSALISALVAPQSDHPIYQKALPHDDVTLQ